MAMALILNQGSPVESAMAALIAAPVTAPLPSEVDDVNKVSTRDLFTSSATALSILPIWRSLAMMLDTLFPVLKPFWRKVL
jgi:hypothetical protein